MDKYKTQRVYSKTNGMRHRMVYTYKNKHYIQSGVSFYRVKHKAKDIWQVTDEHLYECQSCGSSYAPEDEVKQTGNFFCDECWHENI